MTDLIGSLKKLKVRHEFDITFIVIDNDETPSSQEVFERTTRDFPWPCRYIHEPEPGIPVARNRALRAAGAKGYLVFVDDDETVAPDWLIELWRIADKTKATFVQGPVCMTVEDARDTWWLGTLFFYHKSFPDGAQRQESWTNNVLVDLDFVTRNNCHFEKKLRYDGGSDTLFFQDIIRRGGTGAFAANAWVYEVQPESRLTWRWAINRQFRYGATRAMTVLLRRSQLEATIYCVVRGLGMAVVGVGFLATSVLRGRKGLANGVALLSRSAGILAGMLGRRKLEYAR